MFVKSDYELSLHVLQGPPGATGAEGRQGEKGAKVTEIFVFIFLEHGNVNYL